MSLNRAYISSTQVASSTTFDNSTITLGYDATDVQAALEELRTRTIYTSRTQATTVGGTLTLVRADDTLQILTGTATGYSVILPDATTLTLGRHYKIDNISTQSVTIKDGSGATLFVLGANSIAELTLQTNATSAGSWIWWQTLIGVANGVVTYNITSNTAFTTSSTTDIIITSLTLTPIAGTYAIWYNASTFYTTTPKTHWWNIYKNGVKITDTERSQDTAHSSQNMVDTTMTIAQFDGTNTCDVRVRCDNTGSLTINSRSLLMIRLGI